MKKIFSLLMVAILATTVSFADTYTKVTTLADLTTREYVIGSAAAGGTSATFAMNSTNSKSYFTHTDVTPSDNDIVTTDNTIVWIVTNNGTDFTIQSKSTSKFVGYTSTKNEAHALDAVADDKGKWIITLEEDRFVVSNKNTTGRDLQYNSGAPRFACYTGSQQDLFFYKKPSGPATVVENPVLSVTSGMQYTAINVTITCPTAGASIFYSVDGGEPRVAYTDALPISANTTLKAIAVEGTDTSNMVEATYTFPIEVADIKAFAALADEDNLVKITGEMNVVYQNYKSLYVQDADTSFLIYGNVVADGAEYTNGQVISNVIGKYKVFGGEGQMELDSIITVVAGTAVAPTKVEAGDIDSTYCNMYVELDSVEIKSAFTFTNSSTTEGYIAVGSDGSLKLRNNFRTIDEAFEAGDKVKVVGIVSVFNGTVQVYPVTMEKYETLAVPTFSIPGGDYADGDTLDVVITAAEGAKVSYSINNMSPIVAESPCTLQVTYTTTITAISIIESGDTSLRSDESSVTYTFLVAAPSFDVASCNFSAPFDVTISSATVGASVYYTLDGTTPDTSSTEYTAAVAIPAATTTLKAIAIKGANSSDVAEATYTYIYIDPNAKVETFTNSALTGSYEDGEFVGDNGITWYYEKSRDHNGDANGSGINGKAIMLQKSSNNSKVWSDSIDGGIGNFSVKLYKGFTGEGNRQVEVFINGVSKGQSPAFDDFDEHIFSVDSINVAGKVVIEVRNITGNQVIVDDITWTPAEEDTIEVISAPVFSIPGGDYADGDTLDVVITAAEGAKVSYSINNMSPIVAESPCTLQVTYTTTITAISIIESGDTSLRSEESSVTYTFLVAAPSFDVASCNFSAPFDVTISSATVGASVYYTLDGTTPDTSSTEYTAAVAIPAATTTLKAIAIKGANSSDVAEATYTYIYIDPNAKVETFTNSALNGSYEDSTFVGDNGITWYYEKSRDHNGDENGSGINGKAIMLRSLDEDSKVWSDSIDGGIGNFSVKLYKGFTGKGNRQVEVFINGVSKGQSPAFDDLDEHIFSIDSINVAGKVVIEVRNATNKQVIVDDITWTPAGDVPEVIPAPVFSHKGGNYAEEFALTLGIGEYDTQDSCVIIYTLDGTTPNITDVVGGTGSSLGYQAPILIDTTTTVTALIYDVTDSVAGIVGTEVYKFGQDTVVVVPSIIEVETFADFIELADTVNQVRITGEMSVIYQKDARMYVQESEESWGLVYGGKVYDLKPEFTNGKVISNVVGIYDEYKGVAQLKLDTIETVADGDAVEPYVATIGELTVDDEHRYVKFEDVEFAGAVTFEEGKMANANVTDGEDTIAIRSQFQNIDATYAVGDKADVEGFVSTYKGAVQLYILSIKRTSVDVEVNEEDMAVVYTNNGNIVVEAEAGANIQVYSVNGAIMYNAVANDAQSTISALPEGMVVVVVNGFATKVMVK